MPVNKKVVAGRLTLFQQIELFFTEMRINKLLRQHYNGSRVSIHYSSIHTKLMQAIKERYEKRGWAVKWRTEESCIHGIWADFT